MRGEMINMQNSKLNKKKQKKKMQEIQKGRNYQTTHNDLKWNQTFELNHDLNFEADVQGIR